MELFLLYLIKIKKPKAPDIKKVSAFFRNMKALKSKPVLDLNVMQFHNQTDVSLKKWKSVVIPLFFLSEK